jgi:hypothetical protein
MAASMSQSNGHQPQIGDFPFTGECQAAVAAFQEWKNKLLDTAVDHPLETQVTVVLGSAWVFYLAEKDANPDVKTYGDALHYIATCLCTGYANIFPITQLGKVVAAIVMMVGPSMTAWVLEGRLVQRQAVEASTEPPDPVLETLHLILQELKAQRQSTTP